MEDKPVLKNIETHPSWVRLEYLIDWYVDKSGSSKKWYKTLKLFQIILAIMIPVISHLEREFTKWIISISGALIAIFESIQYMNQYEVRWVTRRSTAERLKREKFLFLSAAGPYKGLGEDKGLVLLSERVEDIVSAEHISWINEKN